MLDIPCVILAGGKSTRMGEDKALLPFGKYSSLIQFQYEKLQTIFKDVYISSKEDKFTFLDNKEKIIFDNCQYSSPMVALDSILSFFSTKNESIFIISVDTPFVKEKTLLQISKEKKDFSIVVPKSNNKIHNLCLCIDTNLHEQTKQLIKKDIHKVQTLIEQNNSKVLELEGKDEFLNLNTKENYHKALTII